MYSQTCKFVNIIAKKIVNNKAIRVCSNFEIQIALCAQVTVNPDKTKIIVFKKGTPHVLKVIIPCGGKLLQFQPKVKYLNEKKPRKMKQKT